MAEAPTPSSEEHGRVLLRWEIPEYQKHERTGSWYFWALVICGALIAWALWTQNYLFIVIILLSALIVYRQNIRDPQKLLFQVTEDGIEIEFGRFYDYREINNFWIIYEPPNTKTLFFTFRSTFRPDLAIPLAQQNPLNVRTVLAKYLTEDLEREGEPVSEALGRTLKL